MANGKLGSRRRHERTGMANPMIRVLLLSPQPLLGACIKSLLSHRPDLAVVGTERDPECASERARELRPDVVVIAKGSDDASGPIVVHLLEDGITPCVIVLDMADNRLRLFRSEERQVNHVEDLEQAIRAEPILNRGGGAPAE